MEGLDVDVSRLSVAECLALAEQQDAGDKKGPVRDPVEVILDRIGGSAAKVMLDSMTK